MLTRYPCKNKRRRIVVRESFVDQRPLLNGIDYLEIEADQRTLMLHFLHDLPGSPLEHTVPKDMFPLKPENIQIQGGTRLVSLQVTSVSTIGNVLRIRLNQPGDYSPYHLTLVQSTSNPEPPRGVDPQLAAVEFQFWREEFSEFDCVELPATSDPAPPPPVIDYLAKDYASFRQLMLDRLAVTLPEWQERNPADLGIMVVELLAYSADHLSYYQDAVATEAYLGTCRRRVSMRRHSRLLDYAMHDGCNARAWIVIRLSQSIAEPNAESNAESGLTLLGPDVATGRAGVKFLSRTAFSTGALTDEQYLVAIAQGAQVFESLHDLTLHAALDELQFYVWENDQFSLPQGATQATFADPQGLVGKQLCPGRLLVFQEIHNPITGEGQSTNLLHRHVVRLTQVQSAIDPLTQASIVEVQWDTADALPFELKISGLTPEGLPFKHPVSVAYGNVLLADAGRTREPENLRHDPGWEHCRPRLKEPALTQQGQVQTKGRQYQVFDVTAPARDAMRWSLRNVKPAIHLWEEQMPNSDQGGADLSAAMTWQPRADLLSSDRFARDFVVETEEDGRSYLRFGDGMLGRQPSAGIPLIASYRTGNGRSGNIGANTLINLMLQPQNLDEFSRQYLSQLKQSLSLFNPLPAQGGVDPESMEVVRRDAPQAFRQELRRAVTEEDYVAIVQRFPGVKKAVASRRWTGSWQTIFITVDREDGQQLDEAFRQDLLTFLEEFRLTGHDLELEDPRFIPLDIALKIRVKPDYFQGAVKKALLDTFSARVLGDGKLGFFHPNHLTFGQSIYLSQIISTAMAVAGVQSAMVSRFRRWGSSSTQEIEAGVIQFGRLEIARLDNLPSLPENGQFDFDLEGGR